MLRFRLFFYIIFIILLPRLSFIGLAHFRILMSSVSKDKLSLIKGLSKTAPAFVPASSGAAEDLTKLPPLPDMSNVPVMKVSSDTLTSPVNKKNGMYSLFTYLLLSLFTTTTPF